MNLKHALWEGTKEAMNCAKAIFFSPKHKILLTAQYSCHMGDREGGDPWNCSATSSLGRSLLEGFKHFVP